MPFPDNERFARVRLVRLWVWPIAAALIVALLYLIAGDDAPPFVAVGYTAYGFLMLAALRSLGTAGVPPGDVLGLPPAEVTIWARIILLVPVMFCFAAMSLWATAFAASWIVPGVGRFLFDSQQDAGPLRSMGQTGSALLLFFVVVVGPVVEEFVFRGIVLRRWMAKAGLWRGVVGSSIVFAILHPPFWLGAFVVGIFLAMLYLVTRSLYAPIAFHAMYNGLVAFATISAGAVVEEGKRPTFETFRREWMVEVFLLVVSGWIVFRTIRDFAAVARQQMMTPTSAPPGSRED